MQRQLTSSTEKLQKGKMGQEPNEPIMNQESDPPISRMKRMWIWFRGPAFFPVISILVALGGLVVWIVGPPTYNFLKNYRADQLVQTARQAHEFGKTTLAFKAAQAALQLRPGDYSALTVLAYTMTEADSPQALGLLEALMDHPSASVKEIHYFRLHSLRLAMLMNRPDLANQLLPENADDPATQDPEFVELVAKYHSVYGIASDAIPWIVRSIQLRADSENEGAFPLTKRIELIRSALISSTENGSTMKFRELLWDKTFESKPPYLESMRLLGSSTDLSNNDLRQLAAALESHPEAGFRDKLLAIDLKMRANPTNTEAVIRDTLYQFGSTSTATPETTVSLAESGEDAPVFPEAGVATQQIDLDQRIELARWLNRHGNGERVSSLFTIKEARESEEVALALLDGLAQDGQWKHVETLLYDRELKIESILRDLYLARVSKEQGYTTAYQLTWDTIESTRIDKPQAFWYVAEYARVMGELDRAESLYRRLLDFRSVRWKSYLALIQLGEQRGATSELRKLLQRMRNDFPDNPAASNDWAYLSALMNLELEAATEIARNLVQSNPKQIAHHITLALCLMRSGEWDEVNQIMDALEIDWNQVLPGWKSIRIAQLNHSSRTAEAQELRNSLDETSLKPEELDLIQ